MTQPKNIQHIDDSMEMSPPTSLDENIKKRYLITCSSIENYEVAEKNLLNYPHLLIKMNNYDGTYDFIIESTETYAKFLKTAGVDVKPDHSLFFVETKPDMQQELMAHINSNRDLKLLTK